MNETLAALHASALLNTVGWEGRMIARSKSGYRRTNPDHVPLFNANICLADGKIWHGDVCLTCDRPLLLELAARIGERIYVLYEHDARFRQEDDPLLERAIYSVDDRRREWFDLRLIERGCDGRLRRQQDGH